MDQVAPFDVPCGVHPDIWSIDSGADGWARQTGLVTGDADSSPLGRARFGRLAARMFPTAPADRVELFSRWLIWLFAFDDARDDAPLGASATAVDALYAKLFMAMRRGHPRPEAGPLEVTLVELWNSTGPLMTLRWRQRFLAHLEDHRRSCGEEAVHRRVGHIPSVVDYPILRRRSSGLFMYDLAEPVLGAETPELLIRAPVWQSLLQATADLINWCNDVVSHPRETTPHNYLTVFAKAYGLESDQTAPWVVARIAERAPELAAAARQLPTTYQRVGFDAEAAARADAVAETLVAAPRAYLDWLLESGRYNDAPADTAPRREPLLGLPRQLADELGHKPDRRGISPKSPSSTGLGERRSSTHQR